MTYTNEQRTKAFFRKIDIKGKGDCWNWLGAKNAAGYGSYELWHKHYYTHRLMWIIFFGEIKDGLQVCHKCDNPSCCNPKHLYLGTQSDNLIDMVRKGRSKGGGKPKLTAASVAKIKDLYKKGISQYKLGKIFKVDQATISRAINNKMAYERRTELNICS
jgi:hypothetical protein